MEYVTTIVFNINNNDVWTQKFTTKEDEETYSGVVFAFLLCNEVHRTDLPNKGLFYIGWGNAPLTENEFLKKAGVNATDSDEKQPHGLEWSKVTSVLDTLKGDTVFGWWMRSYDGGDTDRSLIMFRSPRFIQGFISGCNAWGVDFRDLVVGLPFTHAVNGDVHYFDIAGYPINQPAFMVKNVPKGVATVDKPKRFRI
jgi:hypothetical protein